MRSFVTTLLLLGLLLPFSVQAAKSPSVHSYKRLFYYTDSRASKADFFAHPGSVDIFAPQTYALLDDGSLSGTLADDLITFAKRHHIQIMPVVTNDSFGKTAYQSILADPVKEDRAIASLVVEAKNKGYRGYQIDFEQMDVSYKDPYSAFIAKTAQVFHQAGLILSVAVVAKISDNPGDYKGQLFQNVIGVYDYDALAASADFVTVMSYDDPDSQGPIAPMPWYRDVLSYALAHIPAHKLSMGVPLYYWLWNDTQGKLIEIGGRKGFAGAFVKHRISAYWSAHSQAPYLEWTRNGITYDLWYENAGSVAQKVALAKSKKLYGVSFWAFGLPIKSAYQAIK